MYVCATCTTYIHVCTHVMYVHMYVLCVHHTHWRVKIEAATYSEPG